MLEEGWGEIAMTLVFLSFSNILDLHFLLDLLIKLLWKWVGRSGSALGSLQGVCWGESMCISSFSSWLRA